MVIRHVASKSLFIKDLHTTFDLSRTQEPSFDTVRYYVVSAITRASVKGLQQCQSMHRNGKYNVLNACMHICITT